MIDLPICLGILTEYSAWHFYPESVHSLSCCDQKQFTAQRFERCLQHVQLYNEDTMLAKLILWFLDNLK